MLVVDVSVVMTTPTGPSPSQWDHRWDPILVHHPRRAVLMLVRSVAIHIADSDLYSHTSIRRLSDHPCHRVAVDPTSSVSATHVSSVDCYIAHSLYRLTHAISCYHCGWKGVAFSIHMYASLGINGRLIIEEMRKRAQQVVVEVHHPIYST